MAISALRKKLSTGIVKWLAWAMGAGVIIYMVIPPALQKGQRERWIAKVNGQEVARQEYEVKLSQEKNRITYLRQQFGAQADMLLQSLGLQSPEQMAFKAVVTAQLINQSANTMGIVLDPDYVAHQIIKILPAELFDATGRINQQLLRSMLPGHISMADFERSIDDAIKQNMVLSLVDSALYIPEFELKQRYIQDYSKRKYSVITLSLPKYIAELKKSPVGQQELAQFFDAQNKASERYWVPERRSGLQWEFLPTTYGIEVDMADIEAYYQKNKRKKYVESPTVVQVRTFVVPDKVKGLEVQADLAKNPENFAPYYKTYAGKVTDIKKDPQAKPNSQALERERAAFRLKKDGEISSGQAHNPFEFMQRIHRKDEQYKSLESVKNEIKNQLLGQRFAHQFDYDMRKLIQHQDPAEFEAFARKKSAMAKKIQDNPVLNPLKPGQLNFSRTDTKGLVYKLGDIEKRYQPSLESIKDRVAEDLYAQKAAKRIANELSTLASSTVPFDQAKSIELIPTDKTNVERMAKDGLPVSQMLTISQPGALVQLVTDQGGFVVRLDELAPFDPEDFKRKKGTLQAAIQAEQSPVLQQGFIASLYRNATIKRNK